MLPGEGGYNDCAVPEHDCLHALQIGNAAAGIMSKSQVVDQSAAAASTHPSNTIYSLGNGCEHMLCMLLSALPWPSTALVP